MLLIDSDPQANLTSYLGVAPERTLEEVYLSKRGASELDPRSFVTKTSAGVSLIGGDRSLSGVEYYLFSRPDKESVLKRFLEPLSRDFDVALIDTPPSLSLPDDKRARGRAKGFSHSCTTRVFQSGGDRQNSRACRRDPRSVEPGSRACGNFAPLRVYSRRRMTLEILSLLSKVFGEKLLSVTIRENTAVTESSGHGQSVLDYDPSPRTGRWTTKQRRLRCRGSSASRAVQDAPAWQRF